VAHASADDVPALLAEIERLRGLLDERTAEAEESLDPDKVISSLVVKEHRLRKTFSNWSWPVLPEDRDRTLSAEQLAAVGEFLLMVLDHPREAEKYVLDVTPYKVSDEDVSNEKHFVGPYCGDCGKRVDTQCKCDSEEER
jgi:hypothetical protein